MKRIAMMLALGTLVALPAALFAQKDHGEVGAYADYFRLSPGNADLNYVGVGGRVAFNVSPVVALEAEMNYDFARNYTTTYSTGTGAGATTSFTTSSIRPLTGLFGPKFETPGPFKVFVTGKVGFIDFSVNNTGTVTGAGFSNTVAGVGGSATHLAFYPGGGIEGFFGPIGLRAEAGDEIYLNNNTYNNLRVTFGPTIRF
ncbi:MAG TPA: hypothetical protein VGG42_15775 [Acidobacteriaceae bacterium]|jgi:hypothetical protein